MFKKKEEKIAKKEEAKAKKLEKAAAKEEKKEEKRIKKQRKEEERDRKIEEKIRKIDEKLLAKGYTQDDLDDMWNPDSEKSFREQFKEQAEFEDKKVKLEYLGGHPDITASKVWLEPSRKQRQIRIGSKRVEVTSLSWDEKGKRSIGKAAAGALVGGALTAGAGAVVGAAIGGRKKDNSVAIMSVKDVDDIVEYTIYFRCNKDEYQKVAALLK